MKTIILISFIAFIIVILVFIAMVAIFNNEMDEIADD